MHRARIRRRLGALVHSVVAQDGRHTQPVIGEHASATFGLTGAVRMWGAGWLVFLLAVVWLGDTAAYYVGRAVGRHAMAPHVSPHKTWEGAAASMLVAILVGAGFGHWSLGAPLTFAALAAFLNVAAQLGDLAESVVKRAAHVKDSGSLLPGHGGILDRLDAMLFAAPALWYYLVYFRR